MNQLPSEVALSKIARGIVALILVALSFAVPGCVPTKKHGYPQKAVETCDFKFPWPPWRPLFSRFARDRQYMHRFLYNGDDLWPKQINLCARGRNSLLDLAMGPGLSFELGLTGPAWETHLSGVALTNTFRTFSSPLRGLNYEFVWPVITTSHLKRMEILAGYLFGTLLTLPPTLQIPKALHTSVHSQTLAKGAAADRLWARRLLGAYIKRTQAAMTTMKRLKFPRESQISTRLLHFDSLLDSTPANLREKAVRRFVHGVRVAAETRDLLFPSEKLWEDVKALTYTKVASYPEPLSPWQLKIFAEAQKNTRLLTRSAKLEYILSVTTPANVPKAWTSEKKKYRAIKARGDAWLKKIGDLVGRPAYIKLFESVIPHHPLLLTGNFFFGTSHIEETTSGFTHAALILNLGKSLGSWQFERVLGYYYANRAIGLKNSKAAELLSVPSALFTVARYYAALPYTIAPPFLFRRGASDIINFTNIYSHMKHILPNQYSLGHGFIYGAMHLLPHIGGNHMLTSFYSLKKLGDFTYRQFGSLQRLKGKTVRLIVRCRRLRH
ncbi:hypothetical protein KKF84_04540 [Myxococcota bacterium]|nr:hypothetical protein [Myxococcota bacterium]